MPPEQGVFQAYIRDQYGRVVPFGIQIMPLDSTAPPDLRTLQAGTDAAIRAVFQDVPSPSNITSDILEGTGSPTVVPFQMPPTASVRTDGSITEVSPSKENAEKSEIQNPYDGPLATIQRYDPDGGTGTDAPYISHNSWKSRFGPMIPANDPQQISLARMDPTLFNGMSLQEWESIASRLEGFCLQGASQESAITAVFKGFQCSHYSADITCLGYTSLLFYAAGSAQHQHFASLLSARPSIIRRDLVKLGHAPVFKAAIVDVMCKIGERSTLALSQSHVGEACAAAHIVYQYLVAEYGPAKRAHKVMTLNILLEALLSEGDKVINHEKSRFPEAKVLETTGLAFGYFVGGYLLYLERQALHGENRNTYVALGIKLVATLGISIGSLLAAGLGHTIAIPVTTAIGIATSGADLTRAGVDRVLKIYDWRSGVCLVIEELKATIQASAKPGTKESVVAFITGLTKAEQWLKYFKQCEGKPGH